MKRKDCDQDTHDNADRKGTRQRSLGWITLVAAVLSCAGSTAVQAGVVRVWPQAVVVTERIELADVAQLSGFDAATEQAIANLVVADAPRTGGTRIIHIASIRRALSAGGANMATIRLGGAIRCAVSRPATDVAQQHAGEYGGRQTTTNGGESAMQELPGPSNSAGSNSASQRTLKQAVIEYFNSKLARFGGRAEVSFDRGAEQTLELSTPNYTFSVSQQAEHLVGLVAVDVDIACKGKATRTLPLVVRVTMLLDVVTAKRPVNQGSTLDYADVGLVTMSLSRVDDIPLSDLSRVVGQRAKRFVPVGTLINAAMLEAVPLVRRGQLITLIAQAGSVSVVTTGKAAEDGMLGEIITVRGLENKRDEFDAVVTGPGEATLGRAALRGMANQVALRSGKR